MTDEDVAVAARPTAGRSRSSSTGSPTTSAWSSPTPLAYDRFYNVIANPILWFIQHYLWDLSNAPDIRREEADAWDYGYRVVNARHRRGGAGDDRATSASRW